MSYKRQMAVLDDDIKSWITVNGRHVPIKEGQTKQEAVQSAIKSKTPTPRVSINDITEYLRSKGLKVKGITRAKSGSEYVKVFLPTLDRKRRKTFAWAKIRVSGHKKSDGSQIHHELDLINVKSMEEFKKRFAYIEKYYATHTELESKTALREKIKND